MKTLSEFNHDRREDYRTAEDAMRPHPNGIECPDCGKELWDSDPCAVLTSSPPQKDVHCPQCAYRGYRLA
jgi:DNA-directed RNA polymerase subunit RPC12/RpoP